MPEGWEAVVSSAYPSVPGTPRADFAELVSLRRAIVVAGAHGKTTTTGMIAFVLAELGLDPAWLVGGEIRQLGGNAGGEAGRRRGRRVRPDGRAAAPGDRRGHKRRARPPCDLRLRGGGRGQVRGVARRGAAGRAGLGARAGAVLSSPSRRAQPEQRCDRARGARARRRRPLDAEPVPPASAAPAAARARRRAQRGTVVDDYAHHPSEIDATLAAARDAPTACSFSSSRTLLAYAHLAHELGAALSAADAACVTESTARASSRWRASGKARRRRAGPGVRAGWAPAVDGARLVAGWARRAISSLRSARGRPRRAARPGGCGEGGGGRRFRG